MATSLEILEMTSSEVTRVEIYTAGDSGFILSLVIISDTASLSLFVSF